MKPKMSSKNIQLLRNVKLQDKTSQTHNTSNSWIRCEGLEALEETYGICFYTSKAMYRTIQNFFGLIGAIDFDFTPLLKSTTSPEELPLHAPKVQYSISFKEKYADMLANGIYDRQYCYVSVMPYNHSTFPFKEEEYVYHFRIHKGILMLDFLCSPNLYEKAAPPQRKK